ncbi:MAG: lipopolysaccharide transport periplasmic protein LptA [Gammaproteobacteria bacterium]|nr:lipopolysaccharide transport periplasmic protein LptA [Gammaproteobacteria bacterium]
MNPKISNLATATALLSLLLFPALATALESDKNQPITIEADSAELDDHNKKTTYRGNVIVIQGSLKLNADTLIVTQKKLGADHMQAFGNPVKFQQKMDDDKGLVKGRSKQAEYSADGEMLYLVDDATIIKGGDTISSDRITYDRAKGVAKAGAAAEGSARVKVTIQPRSGDKTKP